jgi:hypothetical protein
MNESPYILERDFCPVCGGAVWEPAAARVRAVQRRARGLIRAARVAMAGPGVEIRARIAVARPRNALDAHSRPSYA